MTRPPSDTCPRRAIAAVSRGPSSRSIQVRFEELDFLVMAESHRDDAPAVGAKRPYNVDQPIPQVSISKVADFPVVEPVVLDRHFTAKKDVPGIFEIETTLLQRPGSFARIVGYLQRITVPPINMPRNGELVRRDRTDSSIARIAEYDAGAAGGPQLGAQRVGGRAAFLRDPDGEGRQLGPARAQDQRQAVG